MLQTMEQSSGNTLGYKLSGDITKADLGTFGPVVAALAGQYGSVDLVLDITDLHWEKVTALSSNVDLAQELSGKIGKMAMISDTKWLKQLTKLAAPLGAKEFKTFQSVDDGWDWVRS